MFSFEYADKDYNGAWSWATEAEAHALLSFMSEVGKLTWAEIRPRKGKPPHHIQTIDTICREAQDRITELGIDHLVELLFRFGVGNKGRLWGFVINGVFYVLWWDRDHQVCPVDPPQ